MCRPNTIENFVGEIVSGAEKSMDAFVAENFPGVEAKGQVLIGYAAEEILTRANDEGADLIVMGTPRSQGHRPHPLRLRGRKGRQERVHACADRSPQQVSPGRTGN